jgi:hypothetical protein
VAAGSDHEAAVEHLIARALDAGGKDNVTIIVLQIDANDELDDLEDDTSPGFDFGGEDGYWDQETMPAFEIGELPPVLADVKEITATDQPAFRDQPEAFLDEKIEQGELMYGVNTGIGELADVVLRPEQIRDFQRYLVYSHAAGYGEPLPEEALRDYIGGRGLGTYYLSKLMDPKADPLSPENVLIFATGPLTGTPAPTGGRYMVICKSPLTGLVACSNSGGNFGAELKAAGYDLIIFEGAAKEPVYLAIKDDEVALKPASHLWGLETDVATDRLLEEFGDEKARVACIGPAGENKVRIACVINDKHRAAGRSGVGAVMGAKGLKAIVVRGTKRPEAPEKDVFMDFVRKKVDIIHQNPVTNEALPKLGTKVLDEFSIFSYLIRGNTKLLHYNFFYFFCYRRHINCPFF